MKQARTAPSTANAAPPAAVEDPVAPPDAPAIESKVEFVRQAAYYYYEARGRIGGHELDDWLKAEAEFEQLCRPQPGDTSAAGH